MKTKAIFIFACCTLLHTSITPEAQAGNLSEALQERQKTARSGRFLHVKSPSFLQLSVSSASASSLAGAIDVDPSILVDASVSGPSDASAVFATLGVIKPKRGATFALLSSGVAGTSQPEPGTDFPPEDTPGDRVTLTLTLDLLQGVNRLSFDFNFLSAEFPDFVGTIFNDTFTAILTDTNGVREIARASVNGSAFFPASASRAGGSGFDIFTEDPLGVDEEFGGGLPDAGLTGFQSVSVPVAGGGVVAIEFSIEDRGDGILDSAVILDNLIVSSLEVVDPNPIFLANGNIVNDPETLAQGGEQRDSAAADGVTKLLLRSKVSGPGAVEFCLAGGNAPEDGGLALLGDIGRANCVVAPAEGTSQGFMAFAIYETPDEFNRGGDEALTQRSLGFSARFTSTTGDPVESTIPFKLVRPPVLLVHGLWSNGATWTLPLVTDPRFSLTLADYEGTNASTFATNRFVPFLFIQEAITRLRLSGAAATQVDIAGHSMGGILSRNHVSIPQYERSNNFNAGDLHKLVTLNTPHTGSPLANLIVAIRDSLGPVDRFLFQESLRLLDHPIDEGAIDDLAKGSDAINAIQQTPVPGHALVGIGGSDALELLPSPLGDIYRLINFFADSSDLFQGLQHDGIVGRQSQEGGMPATAMTVFGGLESIHTSVPGNSDYSDRLVELFNSPADGPLFAEFPAPASVSSLLVAFTAPEAVDSSLAGQASSTDGLVITSPPEGTEVSSGDTVLVVVQPESGVIVDRVLLVGPGVAEVDDTAPFEFNLVIPVDAAGAFEISAIGSGSGDDFFGSNTVTLQVIPAAMLESITLIPQDPILFSIGESRSLTLLGSFDDGIVRDVTSPATGTEYLTSNPEIIAVSPEGVMTGEDVGVATIVARNGSVQDSISVTVLLENQAPIANAGLDETVPVGSFVNLDGTNSVDPDNNPEPLSFEWSQIAGPDVSLAGPTTATPTFTPLLAGDYTFSLIVRDGQADSVPDSVTITVLPLGDCDVDGDAVDLFDVLAGIDFVLEREVPTPTQESLCDVTCNGAIDLFDVLGNIDALLERVPLPLQCPGT